MSSELQRPPLHRGRAEHLDGLLAITKQLSPPNSACTRLPVTRRRQASDYPRVGGERDDNEGRDEYSASEHVTAVPQSGRRAQSPMDA